MNGVTSSVAMAIVAVEVLVESALNHHVGTYRIRTSDTFICRVCPFVFLYHQGPWG